MEQQGLSQPANGFDFYVIDLWEHRNLLSIVSNRYEEAGHNRKAFCSVAASDENVVSIYRSESKSRQKNTRLLLRSTNTCLSVMLNPGSTPPPCFSILSRALSRNWSTFKPVFFGATGDLAYEKNFPSLQTMIKHGHLNVPIIGVGKAGAS